MARVDRLRQVDAAELRFRLAGELRKAGGRLRAAVKPTSWRRGDLANLLVAAGRNDLGHARDALSQGRFGIAHKALATHFSSRPARFPLVPATLPELSKAIAERFPESRADAIARAERTIEGRYDVLGYRDVKYGSPPDWHKDPVHDRQPPFAFWSRVPYLDRQYGDHKIIWEINRHQHWLGLGRAYHLTGDPRYYRTFVAQLEDWMLRNPPLQGVNWASMLELALRSLSWLWALHFFAPAALEDGEDETPWTVDLLLGLDRQLTHIEQNLSRYFSPNTHLSGEALALFVAGAVLPELARSPRRSVAGRRMLLEEAVRQVHADGGHAELSAHYHRYSTEFYLLATLIARMTADEATRALEEASRRQAKFLRALADDNGRVPQLGDDDGGQLFPICGRPPADCRDTLSTAAAMLKDASLRAGAVAEETLWFCGEPAVELSSAASPPSIALPSTGYYVSRNPGGDHLVLDAGRHGYLNGGHAHADALSIVVTTAGRPLLVDAGTGTYTMDLQMRDRFRSTAMHNTVVLDGGEQSVPRGPFHWMSRANARCLVWQTAAHFDYIEAIHDGYLPKAHVRALFALHGIGWVVVDHIIGPKGASAAADAYWHFHPDWTHVQVDAGIVLRHRDGTSRTIASTGDFRELAGPEAGGLNTYSPAYGRVERALCLRSRTAGPVPRSIATFVAAVDTAECPVLRPLQVTAPAGAGWHSAAFSLQWRGLSAVILSATQSSAMAVDGDAPGVTWGCESASTDARAAFVPAPGTGDLPTAVVRSQTYVAPQL